MKTKLPLLSGIALLTFAGLQAQTTTVGGPAQIVDSLVFTGAMQTYTVPCGVTSINIDAYGAQGGNGAVGGNSSIGGNGGLGGYASGTLSVVPGQVLFVYVGGIGATPSGGFNGGGNGGNQNSGGGGGATDVRVNSSAAADRVLVAGGGGGGGRGGCEQAVVNGGNGGNGGGGNGANGADAPTSNGVAGGGFGGNGANAGAAGIGCAGFLGQPGITATNENGGNGGNGQTCCCFNAASIPGGGGGGGGFLGGGGGGGGSAGTTGCSGNDKGGGGGGAGGTNYNGGMTVAGTLLSGIRTGNGAVYISYADPTPAQPVFTTTTNTVCPGNQINISINAVANANNYVWTATGGLVINSGNGTTTVNVTANAAGSVSVYAEDTVCNRQGALATFNLNTFAAPVVTVTGPLTAACAGSTNTLNAAGGNTYLWSDNSTNSSLTVSPTTTTTYTVVGYSTDLCTDTATFTVNVNALPVVTLALSQSTICLDDAALTLAGGSPAGGIYSGTAVNNGVFNPATAGVGSTSITYTYTDSSGCTNNASQNISVSPCTGVTEIDNSGFAIMPNPAASFINLNWTENVNTVVIVDIRGREVFTQNVSNRNTLTVDLQQLPAGTYSVRFIGSESTSQRTFVKQ
ncbi:MAG: T9SS type A sorting domain-containing protein [Bacteroidetes bacterium]|nr:T9SS type A sorting domain-containing protein [Bacteroidota bacterium]